MSLKNEQAYVTAASFSNFSGIWLRISEDFRLRKFQELKFEFVNILIIPVTI
jgi:hypothetical protein